MKLFNYILFYIFFIIVNNWVKSDQCTSTTLDLIIRDSCGLDSSKLIINQDDYSLLDSIKLSPSSFSSPFLSTTLNQSAKYNINNKAFEWNLIDGIEYIVEYLYKGCNNNNSSNSSIKQTIKSKGMYYKLKTQPLCLYTQFNFTIYNYNSNGDSKEFQSTPSNIKISNEDNSCAINFYITPISLIKGALQNNIISYNHPTCGFNNGTITINNINNLYSNYQLFFKNDTNFQNEIKSFSSYSSSSTTTITTTITYINLESNEYYIFIDSNECGREKINIKLDYIYPQINLELKEISNMFYNNSKMSFNDNQSIVNFNKSNLIVFYGSQDSKYLKKVQQWKDNNYQDVFYKNLIFGYYYHKDLSINQPLSLSSSSSSICKFQQYIGNTRLLPQINYSIIYNNNNDSNNNNNSSSSNRSCLDNIIVEINSPYENDEIILKSITDNLIYQIDKVNNQSTISYNKEFKISSKIGNGDIYFSTVFKKPTFKIMETSSDEQQGCWKTYNITIDNFENYKNLKLTGFKDLLMYPSNDGVFINVPSNQFILSYYYGDCETESTINIGMDYHSDYNPLDKVTIDYSIIKNATCFTPAQIKYTINSPLGLFNGSFKTDNQYQGYTKIPNSLCFIPLSYSINPTETTTSTNIIDNSIDFNYTIIKTPSCSIDQSGLISIQLNNNNNNNLYLINKIESNGEILIQDSKNVNNYFIKSGENQIKITIKIGNNFCYSSLKSINIPKINSIAPKFIISPVTDCENSNGIIEILNFQEFTTIELYSSINHQLLNSITNGSTFNNLESSNYILNFKSPTCSGSIIVNVPSSENNYKITSTIIRNPTCGNFEYSDGRIGISLIKDGIIKINNFTISNYNDNNSYYYFTNGIYEIATVGLNQLTIKYGSCKWYKNITLELDDPKFSIVNLFNRTCGWNNDLYKIISSNTNVDINKITYVTASDYTNYQNQHLISNPFRFPLIYTIRWNNICENTFTQYYHINNNYQSSQQLKVKYEIVYPNHCLGSESSTSFNFDIIVKNMNSYKSLLLFGRVPTISINSTHSIFKNVVPSESYEFTYTSLYGCDGVFYINKDDLPITNVNQKLDIKITNDICYSGKGSIQLSNIDNDNYYYYLRSSLKPIDKSDDNDDDDDDDGQHNINSFSLPINSNNNTFLKKLKVGTYSIYRGCKSMINCIVEEKVTIGNDDPLIESIKVLDSYNNTLKNGSVEIILNFNSSSPIIYEIIGTSLLNYNDGKFINLSPDSYEMKITITDRMCPITFIKKFTINSIKKQEEQPSTSTVLNFNYYSILIIFLIIIIL
ncbi:hypothetical protein ACTFIU_003648 [Dictyostelium citrinum]